MNHKIRQIKTGAGKYRISCIVIFSISMLLAFNAFAADDLSVLKIDTLVMEKGSDTYSLSVKAYVKNNGETNNFAIDVVAFDSNGFELHTATLSGPIEAGKTRVLIGVAKIPKDVYDEIVKWEWKK